MAHPPTYSFGSAPRRPFFPLLGPSSLGELLRPIPLIIPHAELSDTLRVLSEVEATRFPPRPRLELEN